MSRPEEVQAAMRVAKELERIADFETEQNGSVILKKEVWSAIALAAYVRELEAELIERYKIAADAAGRIDQLKLENDRLKAELGR